MISLPNYDDQTYQDIMDMARQRIPIIYPEWTDLNEHDPGITILELFAWLKEMQQYQLNRISSRSYESLLKLLGISLGKAVPAKTRLGFAGVSEEFLLPRGTRFSTQGVVFEAENSIPLRSLTIEKVYVSDGTDFHDVTDMVREPSIYCEIFGSQPLEGSSALYIGFLNLSKQADYTLYFHMDDSYPIGRNPFQENALLPREVIWEYGVKGENGLEFHPLEKVQDETYGFSQSGQVSFRISQDLDCESLGAGLPSCYWLRARLLRKGCEENPRLLNIYTNTAQIQQTQTHCEISSYALTKAVSEYVWVPASWLAQKGEYMAFVRKQGGWQIHEAVEVIEKDYLRSYKFSIPPDIVLDGEENLRLLCYEPEFKNLMLLTGSNGLPCQRFPFRYQDTLLEEGLGLMVYEDTEEGILGWTDWKYIEDLALAGPYDRCFTYDSQRGELVFGDNENGAVPLAGEDNILITSCRTTKGKRGNLGIQTFESLDYGDLTLQPFNIFPVIGGEDEESIHEALERCKLSFKECVRAVTASDYEVLALSTPGRRVMGAKAIPFYDPDSKVVDDKKTPGVVTVVVLPYSEDPFPQPDASFLASVQRHLEKYRLITTQVKVIGPSYIKISLYGEILVDSKRRDHIEEEVRKTIDKYFLELSQGKSAATRGRPEFGKPILENALAIKLGEVPGIIHVKKLTLGVKLGESYRDKDGSIILPPYGLPYLGDLQIRILI